jgi:hypothetical protein
LELGAEGTQFGMSRGTRVQIGKVLRPLGSAGRVLKTGNQSGIPGFWDRRPGMLNRRAARGVDLGYWLSRRIGSTPMGTVEPDATGTEFPP